MKKVITIVCIALMSAIGVSAQENFYELGNRVGVGVGVGTEGIGIDAAVCLTKYMSVRAGVNIMPDVKIKTDVDLENLNQNAPITYSGYSTTLGELYRSEFKTDINTKINAEGSIKRTTFDVKVDVYPFPNASSFFVCAGLSLGGSQVLKASGYSETMGNFMRLKTQNPTMWNAVEAEVKKAGINIDNSNIGFDENGNVVATAKVKSVRPYLGLGFGRLIPKGRVGFRFELGAQFQGRPTIYDTFGDDVVNSDKYGLSSEDKNDITKVLDYMKVYPVLKLSIRGRIL